MKHLTTMTSGISNFIHDDDNQDPSGIAKSIMAVDGKKWKRPIFYRKCQQEEWSFGKSFSRKKENSFLRKVRRCL